jgi:hypothetical protein
VILPAIPRPADFFGTLRQTMIDGRIGEDYVNTRDKKPIVASRLSCYAARLSRESPCSSYPIFHLIS